MILSTSRNLTKTLITTYLFMPYEFHLATNSSTLIRKSVYDVENFVYSLRSIIEFFTKCFTSAAIVVFLFFTDYKIALIVSTLMVVALIIMFMILRPKIRKIAKEVQERNDENFKFLSQSFNGIKESKISNTEQYFINVYDGNREKINKRKLSQALLASLPGHTIELLGILGVCMALGFALAIGQPHTEIVVAFTAFAYAIVKLLPSVTSISTALTDMSFYKISVDSLYSDLKSNLANTLDISKRKVDVKALPFNSEISINNMSFAYKGNQARNVLNNVSINIKKNTSVAFFGKSGSGKTTIVDLILGLLDSTNGTIKVDGVDIKMNKEAWRENISYIPQNIFLIDDTIRNNVAFGLNSKTINDELIWSALEKAQLKEYVLSLKDGLDTIVGERGIRMSGGQRQRIGIARAFYRNTNVIVFDEATSALDVETESQILSHVSKFSKNHTLIIITHRFNTIEHFCDKIFEIKNGKVSILK